MKSSSDQAGGPPIRHYVDLDRPVSQKLNVYAAQRGMTKKAIIESLIVEHLKTVKNV